MNKKQIAEALSGIEYPVEIPNDIRVELELNNLVAVYFMSDDLVYFKGAISDSVYYEEEELILFNHNGLIKNECEEKDCKYYKKEIKKTTSNIEPFDYEFRTEIPHEEFKVFELGELHCVGIVFDMNDIVEHKTGIERISLERRRQISLGWTKEHDYQHWDGELIKNAVSYLDKYMWCRHSTPELESLKKAGALIAAEIDRILVIKKVGDND